MIISRRTFLKCAACGVGGSVLSAGLPGFTSHVCAIPSPAPSEDGVAPARHFDKLEDLRVRCKLCPRECEVADQERGYCGVRENRQGTYYTLVHSRPCAVHTDPIEKKPLFHFLPGSLAHSIATAGCNVECRFCQNWDISQFRPEQVRSLNRPPEILHRDARKSGAKSIAYTYSEPVIFYEYMEDTAKLGSETGIRSVMISNGYIQKDPMKELCGVLDAVKIDLKAFSETFYREYVSGELKPVLDTLELLRAESMWTEIVVLVIPTLNDSEEEIRSMSKWIAGTLGRDVPIHFTRFHPTYKLKNLPVTPVSTLERARQIAMAEGIRFAYVGNVWGHEGEHTYCPGCGKPVIERLGFRIIRMDLEDGACVHCKEKIPGVWS